MRYWLTTHWPQFRDIKTVNPSRIFLRDDKRQYGEGLETGDHVLIYETKGGPTRIDRPAGESLKRVRRTGRMGIVVIVEVTSKLKEAGAGREVYTNREPVWWRWNASTSKISTDGFVPFGDLNKVLGYKPNYYLRGLGKGHSGLKELDA